MPGRVLFKEDFFERVVDVQWGTGILVVFVDNMVIAAQSSSSYNIKDDSVKFLRSWRTPYQAAGFQPGFNTEAYQVPSSAGVFMQSTTPNTAGGDHDYGCWQTCAVFALNKGDVESSVDRAEAGVKKIIPATYRLSHSTSDLPSQMCPPGLLWLVETVSAPSGTSFEWKIRHGEHRNDNNDQPPNAMTQCYPLSGGYSSADQRHSVSGYAIYGYRLDSAGTGRVYGEQQFDDNNTHIIAPEWDQSITDTNDKGIKFQDPPPLIGADI